MQIQLESSQVDKIAADALAVICFEAQPSAESQELSAAPPSSADPVITDQNGWLAEMRASGEFTGKLYDFSILPRPEGTPAKRLVVIGGGKREAFSTVEVRRIAGTLVRTLKTKAARSIALLLPDTADAEAVTAAAEGAVIGAWEADKYKSDPKKNEKQVDSFTVVVSGADSHVLQKALERGIIIAEAQNLARELVNEPGNRLLPSGIADVARDVANTNGLDIQILDEPAMRSLGMGALLGVAQGSSNPPFFIVLQYKPPVYAGDAHLALVGKGVTFDSGGLSIKNAEGMEKMKYDMAGAAAVLGAMKAIAQLRPEIRVSAFIPTVENMLSGNAQRPGDIVTSLSGKTIEVLNTDAEGRLILADAITYAKSQGATHIVDAATLTGAIAIALGHHNMGAFTNSQPFAEKFLTGSRAAGEKAWQLPMDEEYKDYLKSAFADMPNVGGRYAGSITAAWFLREFADPTPWVHLDIAATAWTDDVKPWLSKGPTGVGVRSFVQLAQDWNATETKS